MLSRKIKLGARCFRKFCVNLMNVNLTFGKFALILRNVNFSLRCQRAPLTSYKAFFFLNSVLAHPNPNTCLSMLQKIGKWNLMTKRSFPCSSL